MEPVSATLDPEFSRVLRIADPGPALDGGLTFLPPAGHTPEAWLHAWRAWRDTTLLPRIAPHLAAVAGEAAQGKSREIQTLDLGLGEGWEPIASRRSTFAGRPFLQRLSRVRGERWLGKLQVWALSGQTPAHFATVYAAQNALFHLSLRLLLPAYAYWEWTAAMAVCPPVGGVRPMFSQETAQFQRLAPWTFSDSNRDFAESFPPVAGAS